MHYADSCIAVAPRGSAQPSAAMAPRGPRRRRSATRLSGGWNATAQTFALTFVLVALAGCSDGGSGNGDTGASADTASGNTGSGDASSQSDSDNLGFAKPCAGNADCAAYGLTCYPDGAGSGQCSRGCASDADCSGGTRCNPVQGTLLCTLPRWCDSCTTDADCSTAAPTCRRDLGADGTFGPGYCTMPCIVGDKSCPAGSSCSKEPASSSIKMFTCRPDNDTCTGDGSQCSPCKTQADCSPGHDCVQPSGDSERFCALRCESASCGDGYMCTKLGGTSVCYANVGGKPTPTCTAGRKNYCDACSADWQCASGRCVSKNNESFCAQPGTCSKASELTDCPLGTFCVPTSDGLACAPAPLLRCHNWKACLSHPCSGNEQCDDGHCIEAPATTSP